MDTRLQQAMRNYQNASSLYRMRDYISLCKKNDPVEALKVVKKYHEEYQREYQRVMKVDPELAHKSGFLKMGLSIIAAILLLASSVLAECPPDVEGCPGNCCIETDR